jgi:hypothetical protein
MKIGRISLIAEVDGVPCVLIPDTPLKFLLNFAGEIKAIRLNDKFSFENLTKEDILKELTNEDDK